MTVARYLEIHFASCGKSQTEIAKELGYPKPNVLSMIKKGDTKLPLNMVVPMANAIGADAGFLLNLVMTEYMPEAWKGIKEVLGPERTLTTNQRQLLELMTVAFGGGEIDLTDQRNVTEVAQFLAGLAAKQQMRDQAAVDRYDRSPANAKNYG